MNVHAVPFYLESSDAHRIDGFLKNLARDEFTQLEHLGRERTIALARKGEMTCGVMISAKDQENYVTIGRDVKGRPVVKCRKTPSGTPMADVNFFVVADNGRGLYATYRGAGGAPVLGSILRKLYAPRPIE